MRKLIELTPREATSLRFNAISEPAGRTARTPREGLATAALCCCVAAFGLLGAVFAAPSDGDTVAAVFPPWWPSSRIFQAAGSAGQILRTGAIGAVLIVRSDDPLLKSRLLAAGALMIFSPPGLAGCKSPLDRAAP